MKMNKNEDKNFYNIHIGNIPGKLDARIEINLLLPLTMNDGSYEL